MNNNQNEAKLKAGVVDLIGPLLKRLNNLTKEINVSENSQMATTIDQIRTIVLKTKDRTGGIQKWDWELIGLFGKIERQIDSWIDHNEKWDEMKENTVKSILSDILDKLLYIPEKAPNLPLEVTEPSRSNQGSKLFTDFKDLTLELDVHSILCLYSLGTFPENTELDKRFVIYWWIVLGLLPRTSREKTKMDGNTIYFGLKEKGFLESVHNGKQNQVINQCTINPTVHKWLLSPNASNVIFSFDQSEHSSSPFFGEWFNERVHINLDNKYLNVDNVPINKELQVVHLGSWRYTEVKADNNANETGPKKTMSIDHIEIENPNLLKKLSEESQKTTYLSLRGISGLEEIPESIGKLENLMILDLRSCHNLMKLPQQPRSTLKKKLSHHARFKKLIGWALPQERWFNKLMVLDISGCYLLDHMPKWISELCNLEVLKGFLVGKVGKKYESCQLGDLSKLINLKKLSIRTTTDLSPEVFSGFNSLNSLLILTITWGKYKIPDYSLPKNLEKLDIRCYPEDDVSKLMNCAELTKLKKLYIRGGDLTKIPSHENWKVEMLRLRFLKKLVSTDWEAVRGLFPNLNYVEYVGCPRPDKFPNDGSCWIKEKADNNQNEAKLKASVEDFIGPLNIQKTPYIRKIEPFGSLGGSVQEMDPSGITRIVKISICHSEVIDSLAICFERNGLTQCTNRWGGDGGNITEINLKTDEYIKIIKGSFDDDYNGHEVVSSLTLETNLAVYGPYGTKKAKEFKLRGPKYSQIIGFHAHCEKYINAVGVYVQITPYIKKKKPFGSRRGSVQELDPTSITRIVKISICHSEVIDSLAICFERNGLTQCTNRWGGDGGNITEINLKTDEYIKTVTGFFNDNYNGHKVVMSLTMETNLAVYGPYGTKEGKEFKLSGPKYSQIIGFHAHCEKYINAVGVYVQSTGGSIIEEGTFMYANMQEKEMDLTGITRIVKIIIYHTSYIRGLIVDCEHNDTTQCTYRWGRNFGHKIEVNFKTNEYIMSVNGHVKSGNDSICFVRSLVLKTNLRVYGPYGSEFPKDDWKPFEFSAPLGGQIIGFHGYYSSDLYVHALGVYFRQINFKTNEYIKSVKGFLDSSILMSLVLITNLDVYGPYGTGQGESFEHTSLHGQIFSFSAYVGMNQVIGRLGVHIKVPIISKSVLCGGSGGSARDMDDVSAISSICDVKIRYDDNTIHALSVRYRLDDYSYKETLWGRETGKLTKIDFGRFEYIKSVRGYVGYFGDIFTVRSLQLITNKISYRPYKKEEVTYGPYGKEEGTHFELSAFDGKIVGFHGRSGEYLNAIGVYVQWPLEH
ncbi:uncharacterized protein LOC144562543 isoform X2 [Carex rostrata]